MDESVDISPPGTKIQNQRVFVFPSSSSESDDNAYQDNMTYHLNNKVAHNSEPR